MRSAMAQFPELGSFLVALKRLQVRSCAKVHENPGNEIKPQDCPLQARNVACAHGSHPPGETGVLLHAACDFACFLSLITAEEHGVHQMTFLSVERAFTALDYAAQDYYMAQREPSIVAEIKDLDTIRLREAELGDKLLQVRDRLAPLLETLL